MLDRSAPALKHALLATTAVVAAGVIATPAAAQLAGLHVQAGQATVTTPSAGQTLVTQSTGKAILNWQSFSIPSGASVQFVQPGSGSIALNRIVGDSASSIQGRLTANGQVWLVNPNGVLFGPGAQVDVAGLLASTSDIKNGDFLAGNYQFGVASPNPNASVVNQGRVRIESGGTALLMGARVDNQGLIEANLGSVVLGAGKTFAVDFQGDKLISFAVTAPVEQAPADADGKPAKALVTNEGTLRATGGSVLLTARAAKNIVDNVINSTGIVEATSVRAVNGEIVFDGGDGGVAVSGVVDASGKGGGETGGRITVLGGRVALSGPAHLDASGDAGGGTVLVGGNFHGQGPQQPALTTTISAGVVIVADAISNGAGGRVAIWSEQQTKIAGTISAQGGALGGDGGFIETSSHGELAIAPSAVITAAAPNGSGGTWLLDPANFVVDAGNAGVILAGLATGNVLIETTINAAAGTGEIDVNAPLL